MINALTTARKATVGAVGAFLSPLATLYLSNQDITGRGLVGALLAGMVAGLAVYEASNTEPYEPRHAHREGEAG